MRAAWLAVLASWIGCYAVKLAGTMAPRHVLEQPTVQAAVSRVPIALLAGLVAVGTVTSGTRLVADARLVGLALAGVAVWRRAPFLVVIAVAAVGTALARLAGLP